MFSLSNAHFWQIEVVQQDRWKFGPLELAFIDERFRGKHSGRRSLELDYAVATWNNTSMGGQSRPGDILEVLQREIPRFNHITNPNIMFAPCRRDGLTELHVMLASLLPDDVLHQHHLPRAKANLALIIATNRDLPRHYAERATRAFEEYIWKKVAPQSRMRAEFFAPRAPLRLLAGDASFWMSRIYRIALDRQEMFESVEDETHWAPLAEATEELKSSIPPEHRDSFLVRRPLTGGDLWNPDDADDRESVIDEAITGAGVMESIQPVIDLLHSHKAHEDFSETTSWVKEDFERSFYSKRAKLRVEVIETLDDVPVWSSADDDAYERVLFRDIFAALDLRERKLFIALRNGNTVSEIARAENLRGHAAVSRRVAALKRKITALLA